MHILQDLLPLIVVMPIGPLLYLYVRSLTEKDFQLRGNFSWHFASSIIDLFPKVLVWIFLIGVLTGWMPPERGNQWGNFIDSYNTYMDVPRWLSITIYVVLTQRYIRRIGQADDPVANAYFAAQRKWIRQFLNTFLVFQLIWLVFLVPYINPATRGNLLDQMGYYPIYIPLAILVYFLGFKGYLQMQLSSQGQIPKAEVTVPNHQPAPVDSSSFTSEEIANYVTLLQRAMEKDKLYLEPTLQLQTVATHLGIPAKTVSHVLNHHQGKSFNEFVNEYRVGEVTRRLLEPTSAHLTIAGLALECGFNSQATFQRAFKNSTGVSPKEYLAQKLQQTA